MFFEQETHLTDFLPTTKKELDLRGWDEADVILFSGDAYIDHPAFGTAVIGRVLEAEGLRVAVVPQPNWRDDLRDFRKLGRPRLFFAVTGGSMDSMVNHYTANKRRRSNDAYTPDGRADMRPDRCVTVYSTILKQLYPDVPVVIGGIEASLRRLTHYDYWSDRLMPSILVDSKADLLVYGMGEQAMREIARGLQSGLSVKQLTHIRQTSYIADTPQNHGLDDSIVLNSHEQCLRDKKSQAENFRIFEQQSNMLHAHRMIQPTKWGDVVINPPFELMTQADLDRIYSLPYTRLPHPKYRGKSLPAYEMIKFSVTLHRGCFGGCAFCTISAHQGKHIVSRSRQSVLDEVKKITTHPDFKGYLSDLGGPSANMYSMQGRDLSLCEKCHRPTCLQPAVCPNLNADHRPLIELYNAVDRLPGVKKSCIGSGIRYDLIMHPYDDDGLRKAAMQYAEELISRHVSGRLKVAPEHTEDEVLRLMRKPSFGLFEQFRQLFEQVCRRNHLNQQIIPYFISSHPGCSEADMAALAAKTKHQGFELEQVQDFTPTPMTLATEIYYTGLNPYTMKPVYTAHSKEDKLAQRQFFFWYKPEYRAGIIKSLRRIGHPELIDRLLGQRSFGRQQADTHRSNRSADSTQRRPSRRR